MNNKKMGKFLVDHQEEIITQLEKFIRIQSVSDNREKVAEALDFALALGQSMGFEVRTCADGQVGVVEIGQGEETVGILAHVDVVGPGELSRWETSPFEPVIKDGRMYGRGTIDDKGAVIASLYAMKAVAELGIPLKKKVQLILGTQEEVDWTDMRAYVENYPLPDYGFSPDGEFPLCNIEKGSIGINMAFPLEERQEIKEEGSRLTFIEAGTAENIVPGKCTAKLLRVQDGNRQEETLEILGRAAHSCMPEKGENAILKMAEALVSMDLQDNQLLRVMHLAHEKLAGCYGEDIGLYGEDEYVQGEFVHRNALSPTLLRMGEEEILLHVNVRTAYGTTDEEVLSTFRQLAEAYGGIMRNVEILPVVYVSKDRPFVQAFTRAYEAVSGRKHEFALAYGGSYAKAMPNIVSWGPIFPEEEDTCHEENEYISIEGLILNAKIFAAGLNEVVFTETPLK